MCMWLWNPTCTVRGKTNIQPNPNCWGGFVSYITRRVPLCAQVSLQSGDAWDPSSDSVETANSVSCLEILGVDEDGRKRSNISNTLPYGAPSAKVVWICALRIIIPTVFIHRCIALTEIDGCRLDGAFPAFVMCGWMEKVQNIIIAFQLSFSHPTQDKSLRSNCLESPLPRHSSSPPVPQIQCKQCRRNHLRPRLWTTTASVTLWVVYRQPLKKQHDCAYGTRLPSSNQIWQLAYQVYGTGTMSILLQRVLGPPSGPSYAKLHVFPLHIHQPHLLLEFREAVVAAEQFIQWNISASVLEEISTPKWGRWWQVKTC